MTENKQTDDELVHAAGECVIGTPSGLKSQYAQAELTRRLMQNIRELNATTSKYSRILIWLTVGLAGLALIQIAAMFKS